jgi:hypothetical protein
MFTLLVLFTLLAYFYYFPLDTLIPFVSSKPVRLTTSSQVGNKVLGCVCAGSMLLLAEDESTSIVKRRPCWSAIKPVCITFSRHWLFLLLNDKPWFLIEGKRLAAVLIIPSSWGSQMPSHNNYLLYFPISSSHITQPNTLLPTYDEVVNLTGLLETKGMSVSSGKQ